MIIEKPKVLVIGAGLGGVTLCLLLEKAGVNYELFERAAQVKPLGSAISLGAGILPLFEQVGLLDEFISHSKPTYAGLMYNEKRELENNIDLKFLREVGGHSNYIIPRPILYDILLRQIPQHKIQMSKKVISVDQSTSRVTIVCADGTTAHGDILIGADGAYSGVRQSLYERLAKDGILPVSDSEPLPFSCTALVGNTVPLDPDFFPELKQEDSCNKGVLGDNRPYSLMTFSTKYDTICWVLVHHLDQTTSKTSDTFKNSEWGPEAAEVMCNEVRDFAIPGGPNNDMVLGDLIDKTPKELISKVMLEEKVFDTWFHGRIALLGDACHKVNPAGGMGAINAMMDAVTLANWINILTTSSTHEEIDTAFREYQSERHPMAIKAFADSQMMSKLVAMSFTGRVIRFLSRHIPAWVNRMVFSRSVMYRPQVSFIPLAPDRGSSPALPQASLIKTQQILADRASATAV
ncbi:hypothetical protein BGZ93_008070 [Podila epicladia]|nr:hypothetical protein BGZ92_007500 [Podila epicladia]KAG0093015.1 hypothetical protein BGZ93_008070 [Podila epicladia]